MRPGSRAITKEDTIPETALEIEDLEIEREIENIDFEIGDNVVYPHHGAGQVVKKEEKNILGEVREYLTIKILHNDMTVMVPCANAGKAGLRRVIDEETVKKVLAVLADDVSEMPKNWNRRFKHNRDKIKTGDIYELAEVVRNLAVREQDKGLSTGEKQMYTRAKKILASEMMYALEKSEDEAEAYLDDILSRTAEQLAVARAVRRVAPRPGPDIAELACRADAGGASGPIALLVAAGSGERLGAAVPKAFVEVAGRPMLEWSLDALRAAGITEIVVALPDGADAPAGCVGVRGGATRSRVRARGARGGPGPGAGRGPRRRAAAGRARRCSSRVLEALSAADCAIAAARVTDTVKEADEAGVVVATLDRSRLWAIQTPQAFRRAALEAALDVDDGDPGPRHRRRLARRARRRQRARRRVLARELQGHDAARPSRSDSHPGRAT